MRSLDPPPDGWDHPQDSWSRDFWRQKLNQKPWRNATCRLALYELFSLLSLTTQHHQPYNVAPTVSRALISITNQETPFSLAYRQSDGSTFSADSLFSDDSRLCQADKNHPGQTEGHWPSCTPRKHCRLSPKAEPRAIEKFTPCLMAVCFALSLPFL